MITRKTTACSEADNVLHGRCGVSGNDFARHEIIPILEFFLARASMMALERAGPICETLSSSAAVAVLRLTLAATGDVAAPVVVGFAGAAADRRGMCG
jgi:hypothetical protein